MYIIIHNQIITQICTIHHYTPLYTTYIRYTLSSIGGSYATKARVSFWKAMVCSESSMRWPSSTQKKNSSEKDGLFPAGEYHLRAEQKISIFTWRKKEHTRVKKWSPPMHQKMFNRNLFKDHPFWAKWKNISPPQISLKFQGVPGIPYFSPPFGRNRYGVRSGKPLRIRRRQRTGQLGILVLRGTRLGRLGRSLLPWKILQEGRFAWEKSASRLVVEPTPRPRPHLLVGNGGFRSHVGLGGF